MAYAPIALTIPQYDKDNLKNNWMKAYSQGTTTPISIATNAAAGTLLAKCELDDQGFPITAGSARFIPHIEGDYDLWLFPTAAEADANDTTNAIQLADNINSNPIVDLSSSDIDKGASLIAGAIQVIATVAVLRTINPVASRNIRTTSHTTPGDGGQGDWRAATGAPLGTYIDDNDKTIVPTAGDGSSAWIRIDRFQSRKAATDCNIVGGTLAGTNLFSHAYEDATEFSSLVTGAYASYDTIVNMVDHASGAIHYNHFYGYEARHTFSGTAGLDNMVGFFGGLTVNQAMTNCFGFQSQDPLGAGTIVNNAFIYVNDLTRGTNNYGAYFGVTAGTNKYNIYAIGTAQNLFNGDVRVNGDLNVDGTMSLKASTVISHEGNTINNFDTNTNLVFGGAGTLSSISSFNDAINAYQPFGLNASIIVTNCPVRTASYTVAGIQTATSAGAGARAFITDANSTTFASIVAGGGSNKVPVYSNGVNWLIG